ncbi:MAG: DUF1573 domain-containing protein [Patescibacteria group bacterium]
MKHQTITTVLLTILAIMGLFVWGYANRGVADTSVQNVAGEGASIGSLSAQETFFDFGTISMKNGNVSKEFTVTNQSAEDILVSSLVTSCMCTTSFIVAPDGSVKGPFGMPGHGRSVPPANEMIPAGESRSIRVVFDPNAHGPAGVGSIERTVTLTEDNGATLELEFKAVVTP